MPANTDYNTWGSDIKWLDSKTLRVTGLKIDHGQIITRYVKVTHLDAKTRSIEICSTLHDFKVQRFTDTIISTTYNEFIRKVGDKYYHF